MTTGRYLFKGKTMKEAREAVGLSQAKVASILGITVRQYCRWEYGEAELKAYQIDALNNLFLNE